MVELPFINIFFRNKFIQKKNCHIIDPLTSRFFFLSPQKVKVSRSELEVGQTVISKHKNLRYYSSRVTQVTAQTFYEVMFDDGSFSNDTFPEDIVVSASITASH